MTLLLLVGLSVGCEKPAPPAPPPSPVVQPTAVDTHAEWQRFVDSYLEDYFVAHPVFGALAGRHEFDGKLPDWSAEGIKQEIARLHERRQAAEKFTNAALEEKQRFERDYLLAAIDRDLFWMEAYEAPFRNPAFYFGQIDSVDPSMYVTRPYGTLEQRVRGFIAYANALPTATQQIRANLRVPLPATFVQFGISSFGGLADFYRKDVPVAFAELKDEALQAELRHAIDTGAQAMQELADWLQGEQKKASQDYALGRKLFTDLLWMTERVNTPLEQLEEVGRADLKRNTQALKAACAKYLPKNPLRKCLEKMAANKPKGGAVEGARAQLASLKQFIAENKVVSIPSDEEAKVEQAPPYNASNFAYIEVPGPYDKSLPSIYFIAPADPSWTKAEQAAYVPGQASLLFTSVHEVWPGHFLQFLRSNRLESRIGQLFVGYAYAEGWAHYAEEMMWEVGLGEGNPENRIGQLQQALLRDVRFLSAIGMHTRGMTVAESERMFREQAFQDAGNARQQAARGTRDPAYLSYTMGKLMIRKLREDWTATRGGRDAWHDFHDEFLSYAGPPIPLVRNQMMKGEGGGLF